MHEYYTVFDISFENKWLRDCPNDFKPVFYRRYIDDIFVLFSSPDHADKFREYLSSKHPNIKCSIEKEEDGRLEKRPSVRFIATSKVLYLKHIKLV